MSKLLYYALIDGECSIDLPDKMPIPKKDDYIIVNNKRFKQELVCKVNFITYHINNENKLITISVNCNKVEL